MKLIPLTQGKSAKVSDRDFAYLSQWDWYAWQGQSGIWYAQRNTQSVTGRKTIIRMHRLITAAPDNREVDHRDGDGLNNQRINLRLTTHLQNRRNNGMNARNKSGYKGVSWCKRTNKWFVQIQVNRKTIFIGRFTDIIEAANAYDAAALQYHGEFAKTNRELRT